MGDDRKVKNPIKKLVALEKRYFFLQDRILAYADKDLSYDKSEAAALKWAILELSDKYNYLSDIIKEESKIIKE